MDRKPPDPQAASGGAMKPPYDNDVALADGGGPRRRFPQMPRRPKHKAAIDPKDGSVTIKAVK